MMKLWINDIPGNGNMISGIIVYFYDLLYFYQYYKK